MMEQLRLPAAASDALLGLRNLVLLLHSEARHSAAANVRKVLNDILELSGYRAVRGCVGWRGPGAWVRALGGFGCVCPWASGVRARGWMVGVVRVVGCGP